MLCDNVKFHNSVINNNVVTCLSNNNHLRFQVHSILHTIQIQDNFTKMFDV